MQRELSPLKLRDVTFEKKIVNQKLIDKFNSESRSLTQSHQNIYSRQLVCESANYDTQ